jgi:hypothetical protein
MFEHAVVSLCCCGCDYLCVTAAFKSLAECSALSLFGYLIQQQSGSAELSQKKSPGCQVLLSDCCSDLHCLFSIDQYVCKHLTRRPQHDIALSLFCAMMLGPPHTRPDADSMLEFVRSLHI